MARNQSALTNWSQYLALRMAAAGLHMFSAHRNLATAAGAGDLLYRFDHRHRHRALQNIAACFPDLPDGQVQQIARGSMQHFLKLAVEVLFTTRLIQPDTWTDHVEIGGICEAMDLLLSDQPTILVTGHTGNWEILGYWMAMMGLDLAAIARPIDNPLVNDWLLGVRQARGLKIITKWGATDTMVRVLERGGTLGFIGDQNAGDKGMFVPFFGRLASAYKSIALLALRFDAPIICGYARRVADDFRFGMRITDIIRPAEWKTQPDPLYYVTARYNRAIELMVRDAPEQYLWLHRRWKSRPRHERAGQPLPDAMLHKIQALPWINEQDLRQLQKPHAA